MDTRLDGFEQRLSDLEQNRADTASASSHSGHTSSTRASRNPYCSAEGSKEGLMCVGGYPEDSSVEFRENHLREWLKLSMDDVEDFWPVGKYHSLAKVQWKGDRKMWKFIRSKRGVVEKIGESKLWWGPDRTPEEQQERRLVTRALNLVKDIVKQKQSCDDTTAKQFVDADYTKGAILYLAAGERNRRVLERDKAGVWQAGKDLGALEFLQINPALITQANAPEERR